MENHRFLLKISRLFPSSLSSCRNRTTPDVAQNSTTSDELNLSSLFKKAKKNPPKYRKPILQEFKSVNQSSSSNNGWFSSSNDEKADTFISFSSNSADSSFRLKANHQRLKKLEEMKSIDETEHLSFSSLADSVDEAAKKVIGKKNARDQKQSHIHDELGFDLTSTKIYYSRGAIYRRRKSSRTRRKMGRAAIGGCSAMVASSTDPYGDFRASMVAMILEKQMFGAEDLERLLHCFLSLNSVSYHGIILDVFDEICRTLFSY